MNRISSLLFVAVFACGGSEPTPTTTPLPPEPETKPATADKPAPPPPPAQPETKPIDLSIDAPQTTLKLVKPGAGKKSVLKLAAAQGSKQHVDLTLDFRGKQTGAQELGGDDDEPAPTMILASDVVVGDIGSDGTAKYTVTISGQDVKDRPGAKITAEKFKAEKMGDITGLTVAGSVSANGQLGAMTIHLDKADEKAATMVALLKLIMMPMWPQLPTTPIGVGAKWTVTSPFKIAERFDSTQTVDYEVVSHTGNAWQIKGTVKLAAADQKLDQASFDKIGGMGTVAMTLTDGAFVPQSTSSLTSDFTANVTLPPQAGSAAGQTRSAQFQLEQGFAVTPK